MKKEKTFVSQAQKIIRASISRRWQTNRARREGARADRKAAFRANHRLFCCAVQPIVASPCSPSQSARSAPLGMRQARVSRVRGWPRAPAQNRECFERRNGKERDSTIDQFKLLSDARSAAHPENARSDCEFFSCLGTRLPPRLRPLCARLSRGVETPRRFAEANRARSPKRSEERRANFEAGLPLRRRRGARKRKLNSTVDNEQVRASADPPRAAS